RSVHAGGRPVVRLADGCEIASDYVVLAIPWHKLADVVDEALARQWPWLGEISELPASPNTGGHLWFDRPITPVGQAVVLGRLSQWIFRRAGQHDDAQEHYYQVVVSASRSLAGRSHEAIIEEVRSELAGIWPAAAAAKLLRAKVVTQPSAVFSVRPGLDQV